jgi:hypothetical protein
MKKTAFVFAVSAALLSSAASRADGFTCRTQDESLKLAVYNITDANHGTRNASTMVISDPAVGYGRKTIARFSDLNETLTNIGATYEARVDLRFNDSGRKGELIGGTKLGQLKSIVLDVEFNYSRPVLSGTELPATVTLVKRNGETVSLGAICARYLKN